MKKISYSVIVKCKTITAMFCFLFFSFSIKAETIYEIDFSSASGNVKEWFYNQNWEFHEDINDMNLRFENGRLVIEPTKDEIGVINREFEKKEYLNGEINCASNGVWINTQKEPTGAAKKKRPVIHVRLFPS
tara:strand:+ start:297 stop:692 length:396 start_codon:yes stop_codon:yes gene_type:complete